MGRKTRRIEELEEGVRQRDVMMAAQGDALNEVRGALHRRGLFELDCLELGAAVEKALADLEAAGAAAAVKIGEQQAEIRRLKAKLADATACNERQAVKLDELEEVVNELCPAMVDEPTAVTLRRTITELRAEVARLKRFEERWEEERAARAARAARETGTRERTFTKLSSTQRDQVIAMYNAQHTPVSELMRYVYSVGPSGAVIGRRLGSPLEVEARPFA